MSTLTELPSQETPVSATERAVVEHLTGGRSKIEAELGKVRYAGRDSFPVKI